LCSCRAVGRSDASLSNAERQRFACGAEPAAERLVELFRDGCIAVGRPELRSTAIWGWIEGLCEREARARADAFSSLDRQGRLSELAGDCERWHAANRWRLPQGLQEDARARAGYVAAACGAEALERLRTLER
jgi:hypothetical protein